MATKARVLLAAVLASPVAAPVGWLVTDHLEQDNDFCNACHLEPGVPLHIEIRRDFDAPAPASLASAHGRADLTGPGAGGGRVHAGSVRCIDCHGGVSFAGRLRVKALAAQDAFWYLTGRFEEPSGMRWPLWDEDCSQCHASFDEAELDPWSNPRFHQLPVHNVELGVGCVECHLSHEPGEGPEAYFLEATWVRTQCARCHPEFEEGEG